MDGESTIQPEQQKESIKYYVTQKQYVGAHGVYNVDNVLVPGSGEHDDLITLPAFTITTNVDKDQAVDVDSRLEPLHYYYLLPDGTPAKGIIFLRPEHYLEITMQPAQSIDEIIKQNTLPVTTLIENLRSIDLSTLQDWEVNNTLNTLAALGKYIELAYKILEGEADKRINLHS